MNYTNIKIAYFGVYVALCVGVGFLFAPIPNVELIMLFVYLSGYFFGAQYGTAIGALSMFIYSSFNPFGSGLAFPPLLIAQVFTFGLIGFSGGISRHILSESGNSRTDAFILAASGALLTIFYSVTLAVIVGLFRGLSANAMLVSIIAGIHFKLWHIVSNAVFFVVFTPLLFKAAYRFSFFREFRQRQYT